MTALPIGSFHGRNTHIYYGNSYSIGEKYWLSKIGIPAQGAAAAAAAAAAAPGPAWRFRMMHYIYLQTI